MTYNKSKIMKSAWSDFISRNKPMTFGGMGQVIIKPKKVTFSQCLKWAWERAKRDVLNAKEYIEEKLKKQALYAAIPELKEIDGQIFMLKMIDRWNEEDYAENEKLNDKRRTILERVS